MDLRAPLNKLYESFKAQIEANQAQAQFATMTKMLDDIEPYVPYLTGELNDSLTFNLTDSTISLEADYASYAVNPIAPSGVPKEYTTTYHEEARGYPIQYAAELYEEEWAEFYKEELLRGVE